MHADSNKASDMQLLTCNATIHDGISGSMCLSTTLRPAMKQNLTFSHVQLAVKTFMGLL